MKEKVQRAMARARMLAMMCACALAFAALAFPASAHAEELLGTTGDFYGSVEVTEANDGDTFDAWRIIDIVYDDARNTLSYEWNDDFEAYFVGKGITIEQFMSYADNSAELRSCLAGLPAVTAGLKAAGTNPIGGTQTAAGGKVTFSNIPMGGYFIQPQSTTEVYQVIMAKLVPTVNFETGRYQLDNSSMSIQAKHNSVGIQKTVTDLSGLSNATVSVSKASIDAAYSGVKYTIAFDKPLYDSSASAESKAMTVSDCLPSGMTVDESSITVSALSGVDVWVPLTAGVHYSYTKSTAADATTTLTFDFGGNYYAAHAAYSGKFRIEYIAQANDAINVGFAPAETGNNVNTASFTYSPYPYNGSNATVSSKADVCSFGIIIDKFVQDSQSQKLSNAHFALYRDALENEASVTIKTSDGDKRVVKIVDDVATDAAGAACIEGLKENGSQFNYYLLETQAPTGYQVSNQAIKVNISSAAAGFNGYVTVQVPNRQQQLSLPITGDVGTVAFAVVGIALMGGAIALMAHSRKRRAASRQR